MVKSSLFFLAFILFLFLKGSGQANLLPLRMWQGKTDSLLVLYISGDGGMNTFSTGLCSSLENSGYGVTAINAKSYFWERKTPEQAAETINTYLNGKFAKRKNQQLILAGYSFGADVLPFIINRLPGETRERIKKVILLSPGTSTDFEIHWIDMLGEDRKRNMDVISEINKMNVPGTIALFGSDEKEFPLKNIVIRNFKSAYLPGGHHYEGNIAEVAREMIRCFHSIR